MKKSIKSALKELNAILSLNFLELDNKIRNSYINIIFDNIFNIMKKINALPSEIITDLEFMIFEYLDRFYFNKNNLY
ncbi:MAG: hypothetical protein NTW25_08880 [Candidatus Kapabacteria bacterium]|nr:hypothetical protein [Candidatus Kapabacteria bacterium]